jgi:hypothetical protein
MSGEELFLAAIAIASVFGAIKILADAQTWAREDDAFGDFPHLPEGLVLTARPSGEETADAASTQSFARHSHHDGSVIIP